MMDMGKYYFKPKTMDEARVVIALLDIWTEVRFNQTEYDFKMFTEFGVAIVDGFSTSNFDSSCREKKTTAWLFDVAQRGFKEAWEVPPEGYRLVTDGERLMYDYPKCGYGSDSVIKWFNAGEWLVSPDAESWDVDVNLSYGERYFPFAVPLDFDFEKKDLEISAMDALNAISDVIKGFQTEFAGKN